MKTIYKYELTEVVVLPVSAQILHYGVDPNGIGCLWAIVDTEDTNTMVKEYALIGTGWPLDEIFNQYGISYQYITTIKEGPFMWHVFEKHVYDCDVKLTEEKLMNMMEKLKDGTNKDSV